MGLAERFKEKISKKDIFTQKSPTTNPVNYSTNSGVKFEDLETEIISKIRKTPYWSEYSTEAKRKMISAYFTKKLQNTKFTMMERDEFVRDILALS